MLNDADRHWRLVQVFLSPNRLGVYETEVRGDTGDTRCNCPTGNRGRTCRHAKLVRARMRSHGGRYPLRIHAHGASALQEAIEEPARYRELVILHGYIEVL